MTSVAIVCSQTLDFLIKHGLVAAFERSGPYRPTETSSRPLLNRDQMMLAHYASLKGPLYRDAKQWEFAYCFVKSFTKAGRHDGSWVFEDAFGPIDAPLTDVADILSGSFARLDFHSLDKAPSGREFLFRTSESATTERLPEPYGKWLQHRKHEPRWGKPVEMEVQMHCRLSSSTAGTTHVRIEGSTFALGFLARLNQCLSDDLSLVPPLKTTRPALYARTTFKLLGRFVDLSPLVE